MRLPNTLRASLLATVVAVTGTSVVAFVTPVEAQSYSNDIFGSFHHRLARYGDWFYSDRWGEVWVPANVSDDFRPYDSDGYWVNTYEYGWFWRSDYPWGNITFHYGRWVNDPDDGWLWIPGYVWSPGWVIWRSSNQYVGWMPMPPDEDFLRGYDSWSGLTVGGNGFAIRFGHSNDFYGYARWYGRGYGENRFASNWTFVSAGHLADRNYRANVVNPSRVEFALRTTKNVTNYTVVNNYVVNRSIDPSLVQRAGGRPIAPVRAADVVRDTSLVTRADQGRQAQLHAAQPILRGNGMANSAPQPTAAVISTLSAKPLNRAGARPGHLFTRQTIGSAPLAPRGPAALPSTAPVAAPNAPPAPSVEAPNTSPGAIPGQNGQDRFKGRRNGQPLETPTPSAPAQAVPAPASPSDDMRGRNRTPQGATGSNVPPTPTVPDQGARIRDRHNNQGGGASVSTPSPTAPNAGPSNSPVPDENNVRRHRGRDNVNPGAPNNQAPPNTSPAPSTSPVQGDGDKANRPNPRRGEENGTTPTPATAPQSASPPASGTAPADDGHKHKTKDDNSDNSDSPH